MNNPYESGITDIAKYVKIVVQFLIGGFLMLILIIKGGVELNGTLRMFESWDNYGFVEHIYGINTFGYIAKALAVSAGIELAYMLFTDGPDEAIEPLLLGITSAAFFTLADDEKGSWVLGIYALSILVLMYCMKKYKDWGLEKKNTDNKSEAISE